MENHDGLKLLTSSLEKHNSHLKALEACLSGIRALAVRNEYCQEVVDEGGLKHVQTILINYPQVTYIYFFYIQHPKLAHCLVAIIELANGFE